MKSLRDIDLNLLVVFQEILRTRRITRVADRLGLSQPAVSNALARLRAAFGDELFVRSGQGMQPTPLALELGEPVTNALTALQAGLNVHEPFDPLTSHRRFTIAMTDVGEVHFMPVLLASVAALAPGVRVEVVRERGDALREAMMRGGVDLAVGAYVDMPASCFKQLLFRQRCVTLMRRAHPLASQPLTHAAFVAAQHLFVSETASPYHRIQQCLEQCGILPARHHCVPHLLAAPFAVMAGDWLVTVPQKLAERVAEPLGLVIAEAPIELPLLHTHTFWHRRLHQDEGVRWMRRLIEELFAEREASGQPSAPQPTECEPA